jgi:Zn-dependent peptidase ImmA (M78 family)/DNA-binding XRE family transcriptional regulator
MNQNDMADRLPISRQAYSAIEGGRSEPKSGTLLAIAEVLQVPLTELLADQVSFQSLRLRSHKRMKAAEKAQKEEVLGRFQQWLRDYNELEDMLGEHEQWRLEKVDGEDPVAAAAHVRNVLEVGDNEPIDDIVGLLEDAGIKFFTEQFKLPGIFGFSAGSADGGPAVAVNTDATITIERQIFTAAHELGHLLLHRSSYGPERESGTEEEEHEANRFAGHFLLPNAALEREVGENEGLTLVDFVLHVKRKYRVSYMTVLFRLKERYGYGSDIYPRFKARYMEKYGKSLKGNVEPDPVEGPAAEDECEQLSRHDFVEDRLSRLVRRAYMRDLVSISRAAEILGSSIEEMRSIQQEWMQLVHA